VDKGCLFGLLSLGYSTTESEYSSEKKRSRVDQGFLFLVETTGVMATHTPRLLSDSRGVLRKQVSRQVPTVQCSLLQGLVVFGERTLILTPVLRQSGVYVAFLVARALRWACREKF
jgi:hypothetical protein